MKPEKLAEPSNIRQIFRLLEMDLDKDKEFLNLPLQSWRDASRTLMCHVIFELTLSKILVKPELGDDKLRRDLSKLLLKFVVEDLKAFGSQDVDICQSLARRTHREVSSLDELTLGHLKGLLAPFRDAPAASLNDLPKILSVVISKVKKTEKLIGDTPEARSPQQDLFLNRR